MMATMKNTIRTIARNDKLVLTGRSTNGLPVTFLGWTDNAEKYSKTPKFDRLGDLFAEKKVKSVAELVALQDALPYGHHFYAIFRAEEPGEEAYDFGCYFYNGFLAAGSGADRVGLNGVYEDTEAYRLAARAAELAERADRRVTMSLTSACL